MENPDREELLRRYREVAGRDLPPLVDELAERFGVESPEGREAISFVLGRAWVAGSHFGAVEVAAQVAESGVVAHLNLLGGPEGPDE